MNNSKISGIKVTLADVFAPEKINGNSLSVFSDFHELTSDEMLLLTNELRHFESIFLMGIPENNHVRARIFTVEEELPFAGHPVLGLGAVLHDRYGKTNSETWHIELDSGIFKVRTCRKDDYFSASMNQGKAKFIKTLDTAETEEILSCLNLHQDDMSNLPCEVVTTGLPYLIVPVKSGIESAGITVGNFEERLQRHGAKFVYVLDTERLTARTWDNSGLVEDIATGSAAGPAGAFLLKHGRIAVNSNTTILQGNRQGRTGKIYVTIDNHDDAIVSGDIYITGDMTFR